MRRMKLLSILTGWQRLAVFGVAGAVALLVACGFFVGMVKGLYTARSDREAAIDALGYKRGRAEASAEQAAEIIRLQAEVAAAKLREANEREEAQNEIDRITQEADARLAAALARARAAPGGSYLDMPVPDGLRYKPAPDPASFRRPAGPGTDT